MPRPKTGKIVARGENTWRLFWELGIDPNTGKRRQKTATFHGTKEEARKYWRKIQAEIDRGQHQIQPPKSLTVGSLIERWVTEFLPAQGRRPTTQRQYADMVRIYLQPTLGAIPLGRLTPLDIQKALATWAQRPRRDGRAGTVSPTTVRLAFVILRAALKQAVRWGLLEENPADRVKPPAKAAFTPQVWDADAVRRFFAVAQGHRWGVGYRLGLLAGLRRGEILGLKWEAVDWTAGTIAIRETRVHVPGQGDITSPPKTAKGERLVALDAETVAWLAQRRDQAMQEQRAAGGLYQDHGYVLQTGLGTPVGTRNFERTFAQLCAKAGVPKIRLHDLRHTHGTALHEAGVDLKTIADRLGHSQISVTAQFYVHPSLAPQQDAVQRLQRLWDANKKK